MTTSALELCNICDQPISTPNEAGYCSDCFRTRPSGPDYDSRYSETGEPEETDLEKILQELFDSHFLYRYVGAGDLEAMKKALEFSAELDDSVRQAFIAGALMGRTSCDPEQAMYYASKLEEGDSE